MAGKLSKTTTPGQGYTDAVSQSRGLTDPSGRGVPDERKAGYEADSTHPPPGSAVEASSGSADADVESDEAPSGRVQGG